MKDKLHPTDKRRLCTAFKTLSAIGHTGNGTCRRYDRQIEDKITDIVDKIEALYTTTKDD